MFSFKEFCLLKEEFNNVLDFLLNPEHRNKTWWELMDEFKKSGGSELGSGKYGSVYYHPKWSYVVKVFNDPHYLKFVRYVNRTPHRSFPRFIGMAQKIVPFYKRYVEQATAYIIRIEKLKEVEDKNMLKELIHNQEVSMYYFQELEKNGNVEHYGRIIKMFEKYPQTKSICEATYLIWKNVKGSALDFHSGNIMQRDNGDLVLIDPLWEGTSPYKDYLDAQRAEYEPGDYQDDEPMIVGGALPKKKKIKKTKPVKHIPPREDYNEIPF